jgi:pimeloyl-ACP methyl ester carboxylesterase
MAEDLHRMLIQLEVPVPYILVAHSFGAYILLSYAQRFSSEIAGLVLVDPLTPEEWINPTRAQRRRLRRAAWLSRVGGVLAAVGLVRLCLWLFRTDHEHIPTHVRFARRVTRTGKRILGEITKLPTNVRRVIRVHWSRPRLFRALANQIQALPKCAVEIARHPLPSQIPVTVISGIHQPPERLAEQAAMANRSLHGKHIMAGKSAHWIHFDEPELVVDAVREIAEKISPLISANGR